MQVDESPVKLLSQSSKGYFWVYLAPRKKFVVYELATSRSGEVVNERLKDFKGLLQTDGYEGYTKIKKTSKVTSFSCLTHARRYFHKAIQSSGNKKGYAALAIEKIKPLYDLERIARDKNYDFRTRKKLRQKHA